MWELAQAEDALHGRQKETETMEDEIFLESKKHMEIMRRLWERYRDGAEIERRRHEERVTAIWGRYRGRLLVHENKIREVRMKVAMEAEVVPESGTAEMETLEKTSTEGMVVERSIWTRAEDLVPIGFALDSTEGVTINGQEVQVSQFAGESRVHLVETDGDAVFGMCPKGLVSAVAGRVSGYAVYGRLSLSRAQLVEMLEGMGEDKVVALHIPIGPLSEGSKYLAYKEQGYVQFATHEGLRRALVNETIVGDRVIEVRTAGKEFMIERMEGKPTDFRGPRCLLDGDEAVRVGKWKDRANHWQTSPYEWCYRLEEIAEDPFVSGLWSQ